MSYLVRQSFPMIPFHLWPWVFDALWQTGCTEEWHGKATNTAIKSVGKPLINGTICSTLPPTHTPRSISLSSGVVYLCWFTGGPNAFSPPQPFLVHLSSLHWTHVKLYIHDHVGCKTDVFQEALSAHHIDWNFQSSADWTSTRLSYCCFTLYAC